MSLSPKRLADYRQGAEKVLTDELPAGHTLWKSWALALADDLLTSLAEIDELKGIHESTTKRWAAKVQAVGNRKPADQPLTHIERLESSADDEIPPGLEGPLDPDYDLNRAELGPSSRPPGCPEC